MREMGIDISEQQFRAFDQQDDDPGPWWWQVIDQHPFAVAAVAVALALIVIFWS